MAAIATQPWGDGIPGMGADGAVAEDFGGGDPQRSHQVEGVNTETRRLLW